MQAVEFDQYFNYYPFLKNQFVGVFAIDKLPKSLKIKKFCICNTDFSSGTGKHWFVLIRTSKNIVECFDSLGVSSEKRLLIEKYCHFRGISELLYNETQFQQSDTNTCGLFCLYYIFERMHNLDLSFNELLEEIFDGQNKVLNETSVNEFCRELTK